MTVATPPAYYTYKDLVDRWHVSRQTIHREVKRGQLRCRRIAGAPRFAAEDVAAYEGRQAPQEQG